ncbi:MAG: hypothetical protein LBF93_04165 [Zoogloeaceae bacterium]|jgi:hypothetical protein|nr:hypothetical protein [Zoogloeaceae bacterium]
MSPEAQERQAIRDAEDTAREAQFYASVQADGRGEEALRHAEMAKQAYEEADAAVWTRWKPRTQQEADRRAGIAP